MFFDLLNASTKFLPVNRGIIDLGEIYNSFFFWLFMFIGLVMAISIHEWAHAWTAHKLGDDTAKAMGRITLNPVSHFDLFGSLLILFAPFGYGKPVPVNPSNFQNPAQGMMITAFAGPISNIIQAILYTLLFFALRSIDPGENLITTLTYTLPFIAIMNASLAFFNLLPIPPLDGSKIWGYFSVKRNELIIYRIAPYSIYILIFLIFPWSGNTSILGFILRPIYTLYFNLTF